jgi:hypothetical protein
MPQTLQYPSAVAESRAGKGNSRIGESLSRRGAEGPGAALRAASTSADSLFGAEPVDLTAVCEEIRRTPGLQDAATRLVQSLSLSAEESANSLEEAAIALGTGRLKALFKGWAMMQSKEIPSAMLKLTAEEDPGAGARTKAEAPVIPWTPESLYLAGFLRILGLDMPKGLAGKAPADSLAACLPMIPCSGLTDIFIRDFISLLPSLGDSFVAPQAKGAAARLANNT